MYENPRGSRLLPPAADTHVRNKRFVTLVNESRRVIMSRIRMEGKRGDLVSGGDSCRGKIEGSKDKAPSHRR